MKRSRLRALSRTLVDSLRPDTATAALPADDGAVVEQGISAFTFRWVSNQEWTGSEQAKAAS
jgi:type II secretory pathway component PulJ